jgi:CelD/BcsL family acetyltransferase involved in cellulose biosynthesis
VQPFVVVVRNCQGELVGIAPFYISEYRFLHSVRYRVLRITADYATGAECLDWIVRIEEERQVYKIITEALAAVSRKWDCIWMPYVPDWTGACGRIFAACLEREFYCHDRPAEFGNTILPDNFDIFLQTLSRNRRSELRRQQKTVFKAGQAKINRCQTEAELEDYVEALFHLHYKRWKTVGDEGSFRRKPSEAVFYRNFLPVALRQGWLWLYGLVSDGAFKAVQVGYVYNNVFYQMQEGFDPDYIRGVGNVLRAKIFEDCISHGVKGYDFLGEMSEHKRRWAANKRLGRHIFIGNRNVKNRFLFCKKIWPTGRYLRPSILPSHLGSQISSVKGTLCGH